MTNLAIEATKALFPPFVEFDSIPRLFRDMVITEKLDGTNALVEVHEDGRVWAGSRTRYITPEADNFGFAKWVAQHADELRQLGPGRHFGEWWGQGIQRGYGLTERRFSLFNVGRWTSDRNIAATICAPTPEHSTLCAEVRCCHVVPVLKRWTFSTAIADVALHSLSEYGSVAAPGFMQPEGIVVYHTKSKQSFKATLDKNDGHKSASTPTGHNG